MNSPKGNTDKNKKSRYKGVGMHTFKKDAATDKFFEDLGIISLTKEELEERRQRLLRELDEYRKKE